MFLMNDTVDSIIEQMCGNEFDDPHLNADAMIGCKRILKDFAERLKEAHTQEIIQWQHRLGNENGKYNRVCWELVHIKSKVRRLGIHV